MNRGFGFNGFGFNRPVRGSVVPPVSYSAEAQALFARMTTQPDNTRKGQIDTLIKALKGAGVWAKLECFWVPAAHDAQAGQRNWISDNFNLTPVNSPTFTTDRGYAGNASTSYLSTGWVISASSIATQNSTAVGGYINGGTDAANNSAFLMGALSGSDGTILVPRNSGSTIRGRVNVGTTGNFNSSGAPSVIGMATLSRTAAGLTTAYHNANVVGTVADASTGRPTIPLFLGGYNNAGALAGASDFRIACAFGAAGLSGTDVTAVHSAILAHLTAIGAN